MAGTCYSSRLWSDGHRSEVSSAGKTNFSEVEASQLTAVSLAFLCCSDVGGNIVAGRFLKFG